MRIGREAEGKAYGLGRPRNDEIADHTHGHNCDYNQKNRVTQVIANAKTVLRSLENESLLLARHVPELPVAE